MHEDKSLIASIHVQATLPALAKSLYGKIEVKQGQE